MAKPKAAVKKAAPGRAPKAATEAAASSGPEVAKAAAGKLED
jgi:hypothetical protein